MSPLAERVLFRFLAASDKPSTKSMLSLFLKDGDQSPKPTLQALKKAGLIVRTHGSWSLTPDGRRMAIELGVLENT